MQIDAVSAVLRPRRPWEAIDLGFTMVQRWLWPVYRAWLVLLLPLFIVLNLACWQQPWLAALLLWWLKPLLDRIPLYVLSHALFGNVPTIGATLLALPRLLWRQWLPVLTWLRFDPARSFHLPVLQLENLRGRERRARQRVLDQDRRGSSWLTIICLNIDFALQLALLALLGMLLPELINMDFLLWLEHFSRLEQIGLNLLALLALSIIEPFYVAAGFALYLNRRTILEAWDIEIGFRRLAERLGRKISTPLSAVCAGLLLTGAVLAPLPLPAQQNAQPETSISDACETLFARQEKLHRSASEIQQTLGDVFDEAQFAQCRKETTWRLGDSDWKLDADPARAATDPWLPGLGNAIELLLWIVVILFAGLLAVWLIRQRRERRPPVKPDLPVPVSAPLVYGPSPDVEIFTDSCAQEAWQLWQSGQQRRALSLLYRASLARLMTHYRVDFGPGATEDECLQRAGNQLEQAEIIDFLQRLTRLWQTVAYAHRCADTAEVERLCEQWRDFFVNQDARDG